MLHRCNSLAVTCNSKQESEILSLLKSGRTVSVTKSNSVSANDEVDYGILHANFHCNHEMFSTSYMMHQIDRILSGDDYCATLLWIDSSKSFGSIETASDKKTESISCRNPLTNKKLYNSCLDLCDFEDPYTDHC